VYAFDADTGQPRWPAPYTTGDGPVKSFVFSERLSNLLGFSTSSRVHLVSDDGSSATAVWDPPLALPSPNVPIVNGGRVVVAAADGRAYDFPALPPTPSPVPFAVFRPASPPAPPGLPYFLAGTHYAVGTSEGVLYVMRR
jgi:hypothetical protein